jgi:hypothetical protein
MTDCDECNSLPTTVPGYLVPADPGEPLTLFAGEIRRTISGQDIATPGRVTLTWKQTAHLAWSVDLDAVTEEIAYQAWHYRPEQGKARIALDFTNTLRAELDVRFHGEGKGWIPGSTIGEEIVRLDHVIAHWVNLPMILPASGLHEHNHDSYRTWSGRWRASFAGWTVTIDARPDHREVYDQAVEAESFVITHTMDLRRSDGTEFTGADAGDILSGLQYALSFAVGHWTCPAMPIGYGPDGEILWSQWFPLHAGRPRRGAGWWANTRSEDLTALLTSYFSHWMDPAKRELLRHATTAAILAVETGFVEQRLQTAYSALEMLSWVNEVLEGTMDEDKWRYKGSAWRIRRLLDRATADTAFARNNDTLLAQFGKSENMSDAPAALAQVRHRLTHPKNPTDMYRTPGLVAEASRLACRYLELAILHRIDYRGHIADRTKLGRWIGEADIAPWIEQPKRPRRTLAGEVSDIATPTASLLLHRSTQRMELAMADSGSGSEYAAYDRAYLQDLRRQLIRDLNKPLPDIYDRTSDIKQRWQVMVDEINTELSYREHRPRPTARGPREHAGPPSPMKLAADALREYFHRTRIDPRPRYETVRIDLTWNHGGRKYLGIYSTATGSLQVWVAVQQPGTAPTTLINGSYYTPVAGVS